MMAGIHPSTDPEVGIGADEVFGDVVAGSEEVPVVVAEPEVGVGLLEGVTRGYDVQNGQGRDGLRMVQSEAVPDPAPAVVAHDGEAVEAQFPHHQKLVVRHRALGIGTVVGIRGRLVAVTIATQVSQNHSVPGCQQRSHVVPDQMGLGVAVQKQHGRTVTTDAGMDAHALGVHDTTGELRGSRSVMPRSHQSSGTPVQH